MLTTPMYTLLADFRELAVISKMKKYPEINVKTDDLLDVADFVPSMRVGIERKKGSDFTASILDGRLFDEIGRLKNAYEIPILLLEDFDSAFTKTRVLPQAIYGALCTVMIKFRVPILPVKDMDGTALFLRTVVKQLQTPKKEGEHIIARSSPKFKTLADEQLWLLQGLRFCKERSYDLLNALGDPMTIFELIRNTNVTHMGKRGEIIKGWNIPDNELTRIEGIGPEFIVGNQELLCTKSKLKPKV